MHAGGAHASDIPRSFTDAGAVPRAWRGFGHEAARPAASRSRSRTWTKSIPASIAYVPGAEDTLARYGIPVYGTAGEDRDEEIRSTAFRAIADRHIVPRPGGEDRYELGEPGNEIDQPEAADPPSREVVRDERAERRPRLREVVPFPESRPGQDDEQQAHLDEERHTQQTAEEQSAPPPFESVPGGSGRQRAHWRILHFEVHDCPVIGAQPDWDDEPNARPPAHYVMKRGTPCRSDIRLIALRRLVGLFAPTDSRRTAQSGPHDIPIRRQERSGQIIRKP